MIKLNPPLPLGYSPVGASCIANVVTCLDMTSRPPPKPTRGFPPPFALAPFKQPGLAVYRALFRKVGAEWQVVEERRVTFPAPPKELPESWEVALKGERVRWVAGKKNDCPRSV